MTLNQEQLSYWRKKRLIKSAKMYGLVLVILGLVLVVLANYFANMPRERAQLRQEGFFSQAYNGLKYAASAVYYSISSDSEVVDTKLPIAEIYIKGKRLDKLNSNLPESGRDPQKADFKYGNDVDKVEARYRGDSVNHWSLPQKSWRVTLRGDNRINDLTEFNLNVPRVASQIANWLGYQIAAAFSQDEREIIVPEHDFVHFRLNRKFDGVRLLLEQPNLESLEKRNLPPGKIFTGDISTEQIYGAEERPRLYADADAWNVLSGSPDESTRELKALFDLVAYQHNPYLFYQELPKLLDVQAMLKYIAMLEMVGSVHVDSNHNGKLFFDPVSGLLKPIAWDTVAYFWGNNHPADLAPNPLFQVILANPEFREQKDQILYRMITGKLGTKNLQDKIDQITNKARADIRAFGLKIHANDKGIKHLSNRDWEKSIKNLKAVIADRNNFLAKRLEQSDISYNLHESEDGAQYLLVKNSAAPAIFFDSIDLNVDYPVELTRLDTPEMLSFAPVLAKNKQLIIKDRLFSKRKHQRGDGMVIVPGIYQYQLNAQQKITDQDVKLKFRNSITGEVVQAKKDANLKFLEERKENATWWSPKDFQKLEEIEISGAKVFDEDLVIDSNQKLVIQAGTTLQFALGKAIFVDGGDLEINGTEARPVTLKPVAGENFWGGLMLLRSNATINNLNLVKGSSAQLRDIRFDSPLSIHNSRAEITGLKIDNTISLNYSKVSLKNSEFNAVYKQPILIKASQIKEDKNRYNLVKPTLDIDKAINGKAEGTAGRWEREYKYTFLNVDINQLNPFVISEKIREVLAEKAKDPQNWSVSPIVGNNFYADSEVKDFIFRDIYFDTKDRFNHKYGVSYRYRNRYPSTKSYRYHLKNYDRMAYWPYRLEFQAKTKRRELGGGFSETLESRFEFRKESEPYSDQKIPPRPPWNEDYFVPNFLNGYQDGFLTMSAKSMAEFYREMGGKEKEVLFEETCYVLTTRYRQHLNIKTPYGSGPNPEQSYIISLDHSKVYSARAYQSFLRNRKFGNDDFPEPNPAGDIVEIEVEFERNVSDQLDRQINDAKESGNEAEYQRLKEVRKAFLADQENIMKHVKSSFAEQGIDVEPIGKSKYVQAMDILEGEIE